MRNKQIAKFIVNGVEYETLIEPQMTLADVLRDNLGLTGTKVACGTGDCGCCTVIMDSQPVFSCLTLAVTARDKNITTIEGLSKDGHLHPLQDSFIELGASQCGFCTPGQIMASRALLDQNPNPTEQDVKEFLAGNLCRCTGYIKINEAVLDAAEKMRRGGE
ncbi:MAG: (2Fe-2S)-binding protein [Deltaproteobacteria bacterium]|nr:(2Fe-2S)-binding protein [Deltaproteobacteria bacterium]